MPRSLAIACAVALLCGGVAAHAQTSGSYLPGGAISSSSTFATTPGPYAKLNTGYSFADNANIDESWIVGGGVGWRFGPNFRADVTFDYRPDFNQTTNFGLGPGPKTGLQNWTAMANGYYDFNFDVLRPLIPYIGAGIGISRNETDDVTITNPGTPVSRITGSSKNQFAWNAMAGVSYYLSEHTAFDLGYRYIDAGDTGLGTGSLRSHEIAAGFRFGF